MTTGSGEYRIVQSPEAGRNLAPIVGYLAEVAPDAAGRTFVAISDAIELLARLPRRHRVYRAAATPSRVVHVVACGRYMIYHRVDDRQTSVQVAMVRHGARRPPTRFPRK